MYNSHIFTRYGLKISLNEPESLVAGRTASNLGNINKFEFLSSFEHNTFKDINQTYRPERSLVPQ